MKGACTLTRTLHWHFMSSMSSSWNRRGHSRLSLKLPDAADRPLLSSCLGFVCLDLTRTQKINRDQAQQFCLSLLQALNIATLGPWLHYQYLAFKSGKQHQVAHHLSFELSSLQPDKRHSQLLTDISSEVDYRSPVYMPGVLLA